MALNYLMYHPDTKLILKTDPESGNLHLLRFNGDLTGSFAVHRIAATSSGIKWIRIGVNSPISAYTVGDVRISYSNIGIPNETTLNLTANHYIYYTTTGNGSIVFNNKEHIVYLLDYGDYINYNFADMPLTYLEIINSGMVGKTGVIDSQMALTHLRIEGIGLVKYSAMTSPFANTIELVRFYQSYFGTVDEYDRLLTHVSNSDWSTNNTFILTNTPLPDTNQGGIWGDFSNCPPYTNAQPSNMAIALKAIYWYGYRGSIPIFITGLDLVTGTGFPPNAYAWFNNQEIALEINDGGGDLLALIWNNMAGSGPYSTYDIWVGVNNAQPEYWDITAGSDYTLDLTNWNAGDLMRVYVMGDGAAYSNEVQYVIPTV